MAVVTEDDAYLRRFVAAAGPRLSWLREQSAQTGGPTAAELDFSRDSLVPLWAWAAPRFAKLGEGEQPDPARWPVWFGRREGFARQWWTIESMELMDAVLYYLAECLQRAIPGARWAIHQAADGGPHFSDGQAVLIGFGAPVDLEMIVRTLVGKALNDPADASQLQRQFDIELKLAAGRG